MLREAKDTQGIISGGYLSDNMASDLCTLQFHAINYVCLNYVGLRKQL